MLESDSFADELVGEDLSGVTFVRDYLQLEFNPLPVLNAYTPVTVRCGTDVAVFGEEGFANLLIGQINKFVKAVAFVPGEALDITFEDGSSISISVRSVDYSGPEAIYLWCRDNSMVVV